MANYNYKDEGEGYNPRKDNPAAALNRTFGRKMGKGVAYLKSQGAASKPAAKPQPAKKEVKTLPAGNYDIEYVSLTSSRSGFYWVVKLNDGRKFEITDEQLAKQLPEKGGKVTVGANGTVSAFAEQPATKPAEKPAEKPVKMSGSPKQVAWAEKIIASKTKGAKTAGIRDEEWQATVKYITEKYGARGWIDMRDDHPASILHTAPRAAKSAEPAPAKPAASTADMVVKATAQGINPEVARKAGQLQDAIATVTDTDAKRRIQTLVMPLARDAASAAKSGNVTQAMGLLDQAQDTLKEIAPNFQSAPAKVTQQAQGITPEVIQKASELQDNLTRVTQGLPPEEAARVKQQINPLAKDAAQLARLGDTKGALRLLDQAIEDVKTYAQPRPAARPGITPEVMRKASELQDALAKVPAEEAQRLKRLVNPLAKDASQLAQAGDTQGAIRLLDQAIEDVRSYTPAPSPAPAPQMTAPHYRDEAPYDPRRDTPQRGVEQTFSRKMGKGVAYLKAHGAVSVPTRPPEPEPNWANLSAKEIAGRYADEMAQIVISAGETVTAGLFEDAGAEFAANAAAKNAGDLLRRRATQWTANHAQDIAETLAQAAETSASPHSIVEELSREYVEHAETVARTELARVREEANLDIMRAQGAEKVQFIASEDERLCPVCGAHHGKVYDVRDAPVLPLHPNCRCTLVPYIGEDVI